MDKTTSPETQIAGRRDDSSRQLETLEKQRERRNTLRTRHTQNVTRLMDTRRDLRGVLPLADFVDDSVRWSA